MSDLDTDALGLRIRRARKRAGLAQYELADRAGLNQAALSRIESGTRRVSATELSKIAVALTVKFAAFFRDQAGGVD